MAILLIVVMLVLMAIGVPIFLAICMPTAIYFIVEDPNMLLMIGQRMVGGVNNFSLLAIPFFIFAGEIMNAGNLTERLFLFARKLSGKIPGGLGIANVIASCIFASMSGSAVADTAGLGRVEMKAMEDAGYDREFSIGITVASSTIGPIIPPSINMVLFGSITGASIGHLFLGGIVPGLLMGLSMAVIVVIKSIKCKYPVEPKSSFMELLKAFARSFLPMLTPFIIIGGILSGMFTPTEAAAIAATYALILSGLVYRELTFKKLLHALSETASSSGMILIIMGAANAFAYVLSRERIPQFALEFLFQLSDNRFIIWILLLAFFFVIGFFMEVAAAIMVLSPILLPALNALGFDLIHFGVIMVLMLGVGLLTPPVGLCLYVGSNVSGLPLNKVIKATTPYIIPIIIVILLCTFIPELITFIPNLLK